MITRTSWWPDTCGCNIVYEVETTAPDVDPVGVEIRSTCSAHAGITSASILYAQILDENRRKNNVLDLAVNASTKLGVRVVEPNGRVHYELKPGVKFRWELHETTRTLTIYFDGVVLNAQEKAQLQALADNRFGTGRVIVGYGSRSPNQRVWNGLRRECYAVFTCL